MQQNARKNKKPDWVTIMTDYVTGKMSYRDLSKKYNIGIGTLSKRARADRWPEKRRQYCDETVAKFQKKKMAQEVDRLMKLKSSTDKLSKMLDVILSDSEQIMRPDRNLDGAPVYKVNAYAVKNLTDALVNLTNITRNLYGLPTKQEEDAQKIAAARLELEQRKVDKALSSNIDETGVIMIPFVKDEADETEADDA